MESLSKKNNVAVDEFVPGAPGAGGTRWPNLDDLLTRLTATAGKKSFLVFKNHKYFTVPTENISFFYVKHESSMIVCFDQQEYSVNYSLEEIQNRLSAGQFFRLNRQYL